MPCPTNGVINLKSLGLISVQINCHYMDDSMHDPRHHGETRDTRLKEFCAFNPNMSVLGLYEGQALCVNGNQAHILTSERCRGTNPPILQNGKREEIECEVGIPKDVSRIFGAREERFMQRR